LNYTYLPVSITRKGVPFEKRVLALSWCCGFNIFPCNCYQITS